MYQADLKHPNHIFKKKYASQAWFFIIICSMTALCIIWVLHYWYITMIYIDVNTYAQQDVRVGGGEGKVEIDTSDWQTYRNEEYGFEFKYPSDWFVYKRAQEKRIYIQTTPGEVSKGTTPVYFRRIWIAYGEAVKESSSMPVDAKKYIKVNNGITMDYYGWSDIDTGETTMEAYWVKNNGEKYMADCASEVGQENSKQEVAILKEIISTFKFIK